MADAVGASLTSVNVTLIACVAVYPLASVAVTFTTYGPESLSKFLASIKLNTPSVIENNAPSSPGAIVNVTVSSAVSVPTVVVFSDTLKESTVMVGSFASMVNALIDALSFPLPAASEKAVLFTVIEPSP